MKVYYIFKIKEEFQSLYRNAPRVLYYILRKIYFLDKESVEIGYNLFIQLIQTMDKISLDRDLYIKMHQDIPYSKREDIHIFNNLYKNEISRLQITHFFIKLEVEQDYSSFYTYLHQREGNLFVCDFKKTDYFFLDDYCEKNL